jgi:hypothetical protein
MNMDISEEAKIAIRNSAMVTAKQRLLRDGSTSDTAFRNRVLVLAAGRIMSLAEYAKLLHKRVLMRMILRFCKKHDVSSDCLCDGDLKGLLRMRQWAKQDQGMTPDSTAR